MLFIKKKNGETLGAEAADKEFAPVMTRTTDENGHESVSEVLMPGESPDPGTQGLFIRKPKSIDAEVVGADAPEPQMAGEHPAESDGSDQASPTLRIRPLRPDEDVEDVEVVRSVDRAPQGGGTSSSSPELRSLFAKRTKTGAAKPVAGAKPTASKKSFFGRRKSVEDMARAALEAVMKDDNAEPKPGKESAASLGERLRSFLDKRSGERATGQDAAHSDSDASQQKRRRAARPKPARGTLFIQVRLDNEVVYFKVGRETLEQVSIDEVSVAASFSREDRRFVVKEKQTYQECVNLALAEDVSEEVRVINEAKRFRSMYATAYERLEELPHDVGPGLRLLEFALEKEGRPDQPYVICLLLKDVNSRRALAVLYHVDAQGEISAPQATINPHNLGFTLAQFQSARGLGEDCPVIQLTNEDLIAVAPELVTYSREAQWRGIPVSKLLWAAASVVGVVAIGAAAYAGNLKLQLDATRAQTAKFKETTQRYDRRNDELISSSLVSFARTQSIDVDRLSERAASLWVPRSLVTVDATASREQYTLSMGMTGGPFFNNRPSMLNQLHYENVQQLLNLTPPEGCDKSMPGVSGGVNVIQVTVSCESPASSISRYRLD